MNIPTSDEDFVAILSARTPYEERKAALLRFAGDSFTLGWDAYEEELVGFLEKVAPQAAVEIKVKMAAKKRA